MKDLYLSEINREIEKFRNEQPDVLTEADIAHLPEPVQKYFHYCGYIGKEKIYNAMVDWEDVYLKLSPEKKWVKLNCYQFNSIIEPTRLAYMSGRMFGILPIEGRDKYGDGYGNMLIKLLKKFTVVNALGKEMDESALVTVLAEALFVPMYALQPYMSWTAIDSTTAKGTIKYNNSEVSGRFYFNEKGEYIRFETNDRHYSEKGTDYKKVMWSGICGEYKEANGIKYISSFKGVWNLPDGDYEYFKGTIKNIKYNTSKKVERLI